MRGAIWAAWAIGLCAFGAACTQHHEQPSNGGETHFLSACEDSSECGPLACICGVCTQSCESDGVCEALDEDARCGAAPSGCGEAPSDVCAMPAIEGSDGGDGDGDGDAAVVDADGGALPGAPLPLVMFVIDSSGSMEHLPGCVCEETDCSDCWPDCTSEFAQKNRWTHVLEALTGSFDFPHACEALAREGERFTYDEGYYIPYHEPQGAQRSDGILDVFASDVRFGVATFDGWDTMLGFPPLVPAQDFDETLSEGMEGLWSYPSGGWTRPDGSTAGAIRYPGTTTLYRMDTGIRSASALDGALLVAHEADQMASINASIKTSLIATRPYGGTPITAALDDLYFYFANDPATAAARENPEREQHIVLITDGYPDDDYRSFGCNCAAEDPVDCGPEPPNNPDEMRCPYPTAEEAARHLVCGFGEACDQGVVDAVHVVGFDVDDQEVRDRLEAIAIAGGTTGAWMTSQEAGELSLEHALRDIVRDATYQD